MKRRFKVQQLLNHGWDDAPWTCGDTPLRFDTVGGAAAEIRELVKDTEHAAASGYMTEPYRLEDFRVVIDDSETEAIIRRRTHA
jgi:hypothetical protein